MGNQSVVRFVQIQMLAEPCGCNGGNRGPVIGPAACVQRLRVKPLTDEAYASWKVVSRKLSSGSFQVTFLAAVSNDALGLRTGAESELECKRWSNIHELKARRRNGAKSRIHERKSEGNEEGMSKADKARRR